MTALAQYQRLETVGLWRETPSGAPREVVVSFGQATLVLSDPGSETPLAHWSLPAVVNLNPGHHPAIYAPGAIATGTEPAETLTIDEPEMIDAIARVHRAIETALPHPGRLRRRLGWLIAVLAILAAIWWLPERITHHAARIAPPAQRLLVGEAVLADLARLTGGACHRSAGDTVLARLAERLAPANAADLPAGGADAGLRPQFHVLPGGIRGAVALPGGVILIGPDLLGVPAQTAPSDTADLGPEPDHGHLRSERPQPRPAQRTTAPLASADQGPDILAGAILAAMQAVAETDPLADILAQAGPWSSLQLLLRGKPDAAALRDHGLDLVTRPAPQPEDAEALLARFAAISLPAAPYAHSLDPTAPLTLALLAGDPVQDEPRPRAILSESEWEALRDICKPR